MVAINGYITGAGDGRSADVLHGNGLDAGRGQIAAGIGSDPGPLDDVIAGAVSGNDVIGKRDIGIGVAVIGGGSDTGRIGRIILGTCDGDVRRAGNGRSGSILYGDGLDTEGGDVTTGIGGDPGPLDGIVSGAVSGDLGIGIFNQRIGITIIGSGGDTGSSWIGGLITIDGDVCGAGDGRRSDVLDGDVLDAIIGVTTGIGSDPGAFDDVIIGAGTVDDVIVKRDIGVGVTVVGSGGDTGRIGRGILLAVEGNIGRAGDGRCADVLNGNVLDAGSGLIAAGIGGDPGALDGVIVGAVSWDDVIGKRDIGIGVAVVGSGSDTGR